MEQPVPVAPVNRPVQSGSKVGKTWVFVAVFAVLLLLLLIFIIQNSDPVKVHYLGLSGSIGFGVAILLSAVIGCILTLLVGSVRIIQLKVAKKKLIKQDTA